MHFLNAEAFTTILSNDNNKHKIQRLGTSSLECIHNSIICCYLLCSIFFFFILKVPSIREPADYDKSSSYKGGCNYF